MPCHTPPAAAFFSFADASFAMMAPFYAMLMRY